MNLRSDEYRRYLIAIVLVATASVLSFAFFFFESRQQRASLEQEREPIVEEGGDFLDGPGPGEEATAKLHLFDPRAPRSDSPQFEIEERPVPAISNPAALARRLVAEVMRGSDDQERPRLFPEDARLRQIYLLPEGTAVVDLASETVRGIPRSAYAELAALLSITRTLRDNLEGVERVKFLVEGKERETLAGHVSLRQPFM